MRRGWILNVTRNEIEEVERDQLPVFYLGNGEAVFEVAMYHSTLRRWFIMSTVVGPLEAVYWHPAEGPDGLRRRMLFLEAQAGLPARRMMARSPWPVTDPAQWVA